MTAQRKRRRLLTAGILASWIVLAPAPATGAGASTRFVSHRYGYSLVLPGAASRWNAAHAIVGWSTDSIEPGSPAFDTLVDNATGRRFVIAARRPPTGATLAKWTAFAIGTIGDMCTKPKSLTRSTLSGERAELFAWRCSDGLNTIGITAVHGGRGYFVFVPAPTNLPLASERRAVDGVMRTFRFSR